MKIYFLLGLMLFNGSQNQLKKVEYLLTLNNLSTRVSIDLAKIRFNTDSNSTDRFINRINTSIKYKVFAFLMQDDRSKIKLQVSGLSNTYQYTLSITVVDRNLLVGQVPASFNDGVHTFRFKDDLQWK